MFPIPIIDSTGIPAAHLDMTATLAPLGIGLVGLLAICVGILVWHTVRSQTRDVAVETAPPREQKMAA